MTSGSLLNAIEKQGLHALLHGCLMDLGGGYLGVDQVTNGWRNHQNFSNGAATGEATVVTMLAPHWTIDLIGYLETRSLESAALFV